MANGDHSDLFMTFYDADNRHIPGESPADLKGRNQTESKILAPPPIAPYPQGVVNDFEAGFVIEIDKFSMSAMCDVKSDTEILHDIVKENKKAAANPANPANPARPAGPAGPANAAAPRTAPAQTHAGPMSPKELADELKKRKEGQKGPRVQGINFTRSIDKASGAFMSGLAAGMGYQRAALIKRKAAGGAAAGEIYLRIDFNQVLITSVDWTDGEEVEEDVKFICQDIVIQYRPQDRAGLGAPISGHWSVFEQPDPQW